MAQKEKPNRSIVWNACPKAAKQFNNALKLWAKQQGYKPELKRTKEWKF